MVWCVFVSMLILTILRIICVVWTVTVKCGAITLMFVLRSGYLVSYCARSVLRVGDLEMAGSGGYRNRAGRGKYLEQRKCRGWMRLSFRLAGEGVYRLPPNWR